jgi:hypothetical protein
MAEKEGRPMPDPSLPPAQILALLRAAPARLAAATAGLKPEQLQAAPRLGEWSANEVLAHLRACADVWGQAIAAILAEDMPVLRAVNPRTWIEQTNYRALAFRRSLRAYTAQRAALLDVLAPQPPAGWARTARVVGAGKPLTRTVQDYAQWLATHERPHLKQVERIAQALRGE